MTAEEKEIVLFDQDWSQEKSLIDYLEHAHHWLYISRKNKNTLINTFLDKDFWIAMRGRITLVKNKYLEIRRFKDEPTDTNWGTKPRVELVPRFFLPKHVPFRIEYEFCVVQDANFRGLVFQMMDHTMKTSPLPVFQLEVRNGALNARWCEIKASESYGTHIEPIDDDVVFGGLGWFHVVIEGVLSPDINKGSFRVLLDGKEKWRRQAVTCSNFNRGIQIQYGCYGPPGVELKIRVRKIKVIYFE